MMSELDPHGNPGWQPLHTAPRDGQQIVLAVAPRDAWNAEGFICMGRWNVPLANEALDRDQQRMFDRSGGWWTAGKHNRPFKRPVLAWMPSPRFDFTRFSERAE